MPRTTAVYPVCDVPGAMMVRPQPKPFEAENIAKGKVRVDLGISHGEPEQ